MVTWENIVVYVLLYIQPAFFLVFCSFLFNYNPTIKKNRLRKITLQTTSTKKSSQIEMGKDQDRNNHQHHHHYEKKNGKRWKLINILDAVILCCFLCVSYVRHSLEGMFSKMLSKKWNQKKKYQNYCEKKLIINCDYFFYFFAGKHISVTETNIWWEELLCLQMSR